MVMFFLHEVIWFNAIRCSPRSQDLTMCVSRVNNMRACRINTYGSPVMCGWGVSCRTDSSVHLTTSYIFGIGIVCLKQGKLNKYKEDVICMFFLTPVWKSSHRDVYNIDRKVIGRSSHNGLNCWIRKETVIFNLLEIVSHITIFSATVMLSILEGIILFKRFLQKIHNMRPSN